MQLGQPLSQGHSCASLGHRVLGFRFWASGSQTNPEPRTSQVAVAEKTRTQSTMNALSIYLKSGQLYIEAESQDSQP